MYTLTFMLALGLNPEVKGGDIETDYEALNLSFLPYKLG